MTAGPIERLSALDTAFLHIEREGLPIHIGSVGIFDGGPLLDDHGDLPLDALRAQVEQRLDGLPRLRRRVAWPPLGVGRPFWVDDVDFDVANHVDAVALPEGSGTEDLRAYTEELIAQPLPTDRPLWHLRFVTGLEGGRFGLVERVHHALVDGVSSVDVATVLLDVSPDPEPLVGSTWVPPAGLTPAELAVEDVREQATASVQALRGLAGALTHPLRTARRGATLAGALGTVALDGVLAPRSSLNAPVGGQRRLAWVTAGLDEVKQAGRIHRATCNDVALAAVAHGLRALLLERGEVLLPDDVVKVLVPVSLRDDGQRGALGNQVGAMLLRLPIGIGDPIDRLQAIARTSERLKRRHEASAVDLLLNAADLLPANVIGPVARLTNDQRVVNVIVTNVPGPPVPLYCRGARLLEAYPYVPLGGNFTVEVALLSYVDVLSLSVTVDASHVPELDVLREGIAAGLAAVGV